MNATESKKLFETLFTAFPQFADWFAGIRDRSATMAVWKETLSQVEFQDCMDVVAYWTSGRETFPAAYERDQTIYKLASAARSKVGERLRRRESERIQQIGRERPAQDGKFVSGAEILRFAFRLKAEVLAGRMTEEERSALVDERIARITQ